ncbi:MAG: AraC family transcriptional regulator ligand-binding domain-containing protein [Halieaceae bacterium]|jgi:AraC-like DNA-binding protein|nr:AraC family transcriptional regulator ligand-binding domain-containing protein [Halieaceae bacterium]
MNPTETVIASGNLATPRRTVMGVLGQCGLFGMDEAGTREIVTRAGLPARALEEPDFPISLDQELEICNALVCTLAARRSPLVAVFNATQNVGIEMLGVLGMAMRHAGNAVEALTTCLRFPQLTGGHSRFRVWRQSNQLLFSFTMERPTVRSASAQELDNLVQYCLALDVIMSARNVDCILQSGRQPLRISLPFHRPDDWGALRVQLPCRVDFDQPEACIAYPADIQDIPLPDANPLLFRSYVSIAQQQSQMLAEEFSLAERVTRWLWAYTPPPDRGEIAGLLAMSERNLTRQLGNEGTSYSTLLARVQEERAKNFLRDPAYTVAQISYRLGYAEPPVFSRAFRAWTGQSPGAWRKLNQ